MKKNKKNLQLLTIGDLCSLLVCGRTQLNTMVHERTLPKPMYINDRPRWLQADIEKWLLTKQQENGQNIKSEGADQVKEKL